MRNKDPPTTPAKAAKAKGGESPASASTTVPSTTTPGSLQEVLAAKLAKLDAEE